MRFRLTIPHEAQLLAAVRQLAERVAQCSGFTAADAGDIASKVAQAVEGALAHASGPRDREGVDIRFERDATHLDVWLRFRDDGRDLPGASETPRGEGSQAAERVETGREGDVSFWRLRRALPHEKVNHQCEMPPER